jgi:hypothetical protein
LFLAGGLYFKNSNDALKTYGTTLKDFSKTDAKTIHRALLFNPSEGWGYNKEYKIDCDVFLIDELSMVSVELMTHVIDAIDYLRETREVGEKVAIIGGGLTGCEIAYDAILSILCLNTSLETFSKKLFILTLGASAIKHLTFSISIFDRSNTIPPPILNP